MADAKSVLILSRHAPYQGSLARSALDLALAAAAFEQPVSVLFAGDGVLQLLPEQAPEHGTVRNHGKVLSSLPLYDLDQLYVDADALAQFGLSADDLLLPAQAVSGDSLQRLLQQHDHVVSL